jgi:tripartite-type tricarboxylate transporter receptor subunit TctC
MAIVNKINADINEALHDPDVQKKLANLNAEVVGGTQQQTADYFKAEIARWGKVIKDANVKIDQ